MESLIGPILTPRRTEPEDMGDIPNGPSNDEYYHDEYDELRPYHWRDKCRNRPYRHPLTGRYQGYPRNQRHDDPYDVTRKVKVDVPDFDGIYDPNAFVDWLDRLKDYFEFYGMTNIHRLQFAKMKFVGFAKKY